MFVGHNVNEKIVLSGHGNTKLKVSIQILRKRRPEVVLFSIQGDLSPAASLIRDREGGIERIVCLCFLCGDYINEINFLVLSAINKGMLMSPFSCFRLRNEKRTLSCGLNFLR